MRWALVNIETNTVEYIIIWDGTGDLYQNRPWIPIQLNENEYIIEPGWVYDPNSDIRFAKPDNLNNP